MRRIFTILALAVIAISCDTDNEQNDSPNESAKKLKSIKTSTSGTVYEYGTNNFVKTEYINFGVDGIVGKDEYIYNSDNQIVEVNQGNRNKEIDGSYRDFTVNITYEYDNGLIVSSMQSDGYLDESERNITETTYEYTGGKLVKKIEEITDIYNNFYTLHTFYTYENDKLKFTERKNFDNGNYTGSSTIINVEYDSKINPEYKLFPESFLKINPFMSSNNIVSYINDKDVNSSYEAVILYNQNNLPEKITKTYKTGNEIEYLYEYE